MEARPLALETIAYAADDVAHLFALHRLWAPHFAKRSVLAASMRRTHGSITSSTKSRIDFPLVRPLRLAFVYRNLDV